MMAVFRARDFALTSGAVLGELEIAYETYGRLATDASNCIVVTHGITSSHHAAGVVAADRRTGWWNEVIGAGKLFDTNHYCIVSSNMLGSCYGSTGPSSIDPGTGDLLAPGFRRSALPISSGRNICCCAPWECSD
jgi:homoserine O-acetyltransferase